MPTGVYVRTIEHRKQIGLKSKGRITNRGQHWKIKDTSKMGHPYWKSKKFSKEHCKKISDSLSGIKHYRWIKDRTKLKRKNKQGERRTSAYFYWRQEVWKRDGWKCKINKDCNGRIEAHHIYNWTDYTQLRYNINNGITLCHLHHPRKWKDEERLIPYFKKLITNK